MAGHFRRGWLRGAVALLASAAAPPTAAPEPRLEWRPLAAAAGEEISALAVEPGSGALAVGDARGLRLVKEGAVARGLLRRGPVRDVAFGPGGGLLAATDVGLFRVDSDGRVVAESPAPGAAGRAVRRISVSDAGIAVATEAGAFLSDAARGWRRLARGLPARDATAVALRADEGFAVVDGRLWKISGVAAPDAAGRAERQILPFADDAEGPVDVVFEIGGADVVVVFPASFAVREVARGDWRVVRPALPPGARARRLAQARGRLWLATDRGLLTAATLAGPWRRAPRPTGSADVRSVVSDGAVLYVAADDGVWVARGSRGAIPLRTPEGDPPIQLVQQAALRYLELHTGPLAALRRGVTRRGWLPIVGLRFGYARDEDRSVDNDQSFVSGETRQLVDLERGRARDLEASLSFSWDLGDVAYHPEQVDVSREAREVIKLRDDVLDEVTQLYFERRRVLAELAARLDSPPAETLDLQFRAAELAAGIDAWTGGWFTRVRATGRP